MFCLVALICDKLFGVSSLGVSQLLLVISGEKAKEGERCYQSCRMKFQSHDEAAVCRSRVKETSLDVVAGGARLAS